MVKQKLLLLLSLLCFYITLGQNINNKDVAIASLDDVIDIRGLIYYKADSSLVTGKVIRYNRKKESKRYIMVIEGKPDKLGWIYENEKKYVKPEESALGNILTVAAVTTGLVMEVSGNNIDVPFPDSNSVKNDNNRLIENEITPLLNYNKEISVKANDNMLQRNEISKNLQLNENSDIIEKPIEGPYQKKHEDGQIEIEGNYIDGLMNGVWKTYYSNGKIKSKGVYIDGKQNGIWEEYYENGQLKRKVNYESGVKNSLWVQYHSNSQLWGEGYYKDGRMFGEWNYYDENGNLILSENYDN